MRFLRISGVDWFSYAFLACLRRWWWPRGKLPTVQPIPLRIGKNLASASLEGKNPAPLFLPRHGTIPRVTTTRGTLMVDRNALENFIRPKPMASLGYSGSSSRQPPVAEVLCVSMKYRYEKGCAYVDGEHRSGVRYKIQERNVVMVRKAGKKGKTSPSKTVNLAAVLAKEPQFTNFDMWLVGDTPLITHAWSEKAKRAMLAKHVKAPKAGKEARDPEADYVSSLYEMEKGKYGFPAMGVKNCILSAAHKDKGIPRTVVMAALWLNADMYRVRPALAGAICDMPLIRIYGSDPEMREDMVKIGGGLNKIASLAYRGQFWPWAMKITGRFNSTVLNEEMLVFLVRECGVSFGLGEWRNERKGMFGAFHLGDPDEQKAWEKFASGTGKSPVPVSYAQAAE